MEHFILTLGALLAGAAILAILFRFVKQSSIIAFIAIGVVAGLFREEFHIPHEMIELFTEIGIILLLFMAGLEVEFESIKKRWRLLLLDGLGQIILTAALGVGLAFLILDVRGIATLVYFGLCLTLSSTIIVLGYLKIKKEMESFHGQIILGLMVLQDITAVIALVILSSLSGEGSLAASIGMIVLKMVGLAFFLFIMAKLVLNKLFRHLAESKELLFVGSLGWAMGIAALCELFHFSPEIGAFMAGASLSFLPYRLEIQDKVEPMKDFGVILFFLALGYGLDIDRSVFSLIPSILAVSAFVLFGTPVIMLLIGFIARLKSRPSFMIGTIVNQISEFSLILATLCLQAEIFNQRVFVLVTLSTITTIFLSSLGHQFLQPLYNLFKIPLSFIDRRSKVVLEAELKGFELKDHIVIINYNELAEKVIDYFLSNGRRVLLIDIDPAVYDVVSSKHENLRCMYADIFDPDTWDDAGFRDAEAIISCLIAGQEAELGILRWMKDSGLEITFIAATDSYREALELYDAGATYVIQTEELAAERFGELLVEHGKSLKSLTTKGKKHRESLRSRSTDTIFKFA